MTTLLLENDFFKSSDLPMIASLVCYGYPVEAIDKTEPRRAVFYVRRDQRLDELIQRFFSRQLTVDPSTFFHVLKDLKTRIYEQ